MKISWIEPNTLAASGIPFDAKDIHSLHQQGIRAILSLTEQPLWSQRSITPDLMGELDLLYHHIPLIDHHPPLPEQVPHITALFAEMAAQERPLFVHCHAGVGRTGTILHLYYLWKGLTYPEAYTAVRTKRVQCILLSDAQKGFLHRYAAGTI